MVSLGQGVEWLEGSDTLARLRAPWADLVERDPDASLFQTPEWVAAWWRHLGRGRLRLLACWRRDRLVGLVPLVERRERVRGVPAHVLAFAGEPLADRLGFLADPDEPEISAALAAALAAEAGRHDLMRAGDVEAGSRADAALDHATRHAGLVAVRRVCARAPRLLLDRAWPEIEAAYPRALRTRLRRARRRQENAGRLTYRRWQPSPAEIPALLIRLSDLEARSWKGERQLGIFSTPALSAFFHALSEALAARGWLDVATLWADDRLVAYRYGFRFRGVFLDYNLAHDPRDAPLSPGRVLLDELVRDSHRLGLIAVDASRGRIDPPHLLAEWPSISRWHVRWLVFGATARGRLLGTAERWVRPVLRRFRVGTRATP
jgi:CelD/BcsL family acetyltransferase involved in cellulose biosynthesis